MKTQNSLFVFLILIVAISSCREDNLKTVKIGNQIWMKKNLNISFYQNGDTIPQAKSSVEWRKLNKQKIGAWCYYKWNPEYGEKFGKLYNWYAVNDPRGLAPEGFHIPNNNDWQSLINYLGGKSTAGGMLKDTLYYWEYPNEGATNESSFSALPAGYCKPNGKFIYLGMITYFWSKDENTDKTAHSYYVIYNRAEARNYHAFKSKGFSVRCIKNLNINSSEQNNVYLPVKAFCKKYNESILNKDLMSWVRSSLRLQKHFKEDPEEVRDDFKKTFVNYQNYKITPINVKRGNYNFTYKNINTEAVDILIEITATRNSKQLHAKDTMTMLQINKRIKEKFPWIISEVNDWVVTDW